MNHQFHYHSASSYDEALALMGEYGAAARLLAGGTDLLVNIRAGMMQPEHVIDIKRIPAIQSLDYTEATGLSIGAGVTINMLMNAEVVQNRYPLLGQCARQLASHQVRNRATVVGNIVNASPCADMAPALLCLEAAIEIRSATGVRAVPCHTFFTGAKQTILQPGEMVSRILVPAAWADAGGGYRKLKRIQGHDLGIVGVALMKKNGAARVAVSSAAPTPVLVGAFAATDTVDAVAAALAAAIRPIDDVRCSREYRLFMADIYLKRLWQEVQ
jgi:CO/xanthine dehydrogenase FAD-binding subunit